MSNGVTVDSLLQEGEAGKYIEELSFESGLSLLEELVKRVEGGELPLEQSILAYERGVQLLSHLRELISGAEEKLETLQAAATGVNKKKTKK